jgi:putative spermidine/putrescine transport system substrate-binding protein
MVSRSIKIRFSISSLPVLGGQKHLRRNILSPIVSLFILLACVGCGAANATSASGNTQTTLTLYAGGDVNVKNLWNNTLIPAFEKAHPSIKVHLVYSGTADDTTFARISAAVAAKKDPGIDLLDSSTVQQGATANILMPITTSQVPLISRVDPTLLKAVSSEGLPYRASSVVLAYNSDEVKQPPTTLSDLLTWIKAHPGKFTYNTPASGGSGYAFVESVLKSHISASNKSSFETGYNSALESQWEAGFQELKDLKSSIYNNGFYPDGNTPVLQLLANNSISLAPVWSDMALTALADHQLPANIKLLQLNPPFDGGPAYLGVPRYAAHATQAYTLMNWLLSPDIQASIIANMHGYPGVQWSYVPASVQAQYASIAKSYDASFSSKFEADMGKSWQSEVAGG